MKVAVIGSGSWGTALAQTLGTAGHQVVMWARKEEVARSITESHVNPRYLSDVTLSDHISATCDLADCLQDVDAAVLVVPSHLVRQFATEMKDAVGLNLPLLVCSKGVEEDSGLLPVEICNEVMGNLSRLAALSGPNHAEEVVLGLPCATVIASSEASTAQFFQQLFSTSFFRCYTSSDYVGVELCAAFKNVIAIAVGAAYGHGFGDNTAAMIMTRGMAEMSRLVQACGGHAMTVMGLAGAGDLIATCTSEHSRNRTFGKCLAAGISLEEYERNTHMVVEGALACRTISQLAEKVGVELPIASVVRACVWEGYPLAKTVEVLFSRPSTTEFWGIEGADV